MARARQSTPDFGLGPEANVLRTLQGVASPLESGICVVCRERIWHT